MDGRSLLVLNARLDADDDILGFTTDWVAALARRWQRVTVITLQRGRVALPANCSVLSLGKEDGLPRWRRFVRLYRHLAVAVRQQRVEACFAHMVPTMALAAAPLLAPLRIPTVLWYAHGAVPWHLRCAEPVVRAIATSTAHGCRLSSRKIAVIGQGIDVARFAPAQTPPAGPFTILYVGRIAPVKALEELIDAVTLLRGGPACRLICAGPTLNDRDRTYLAALRQRAADAGIAELVSFPGQVPNRSVHELYRSAHCLVNPSRTGSLDKTGLEAMACGLPLITSNPAFADVLAAAQASDLAYPAGDAAALASRLARLAALDRLAARLGGLLRPR